MRVKRFITSKRKLAVMISCLLVTAALGVCGVLAHYVDADKANNQFVIGGNTIEIVEKFDPPKELVPGISFNKNINVRNTGTVDCYVRVMVAFTDSDMGKYCTVDWNTRDWVYDSEDNYWYYKPAIAEGESTTNLFTTVTLSDSIDPAAIKDFDIIVYAESYQAYGFSDYVSAWENYQVNKP